MQKALNAAASAINFGRQLVSGLHQENTSPSVPNLEKVKAERASRRPDDRVRSFHYLLDDYIKNPDENLLNIIIADLIWILTLPNSESYINIICDHFPTVETILHSYQNLILWEKGEAFNPILLPSYIQYDFYRHLSENSEKLQWEISWLMYLQSQIEIHLRAETSGKGIDYDSLPLIPEAVYTQVHRLMNKLMSIDEKALKAIQNKVANSKESKSKGQAYDEFTWKQALMNFCKEYNIDPKVVGPVKEPTEPPVEFDPISQVRIALRLIDDLIDKCKNESRKKEYQKYKEIGEQYLNAIALRDMLNAINQLHSDTNKTVES